MCTRLPSHYSKETVTLKVTLHKPQGTVPRVTQGLLATLLGEQEEHSNAQSWWHTSMVPALGR